MAKKITQTESALVYVLRTCDKDMKAYGGFVWPRSGPVAALDWKPIDECGNGLHGLLWGEGSVSNLSTDADAVWMVVEVAADTIVGIAGKVKFPSGNVVFAGHRAAAIADIVARGADPSKVVFNTVIAGTRGTATAGDHGMATAGYRGTAMAGDHGTATAGYGGTAMAGDGGTISILYWDDKRLKYRRAIAEVGENGIEKDRPYFVKNGVLMVKS